MRKWTLQGGEGYPHPVPPRGGVGYIRWGAAETASEFLKKIRFGEL
jgi:hypothetical protein